MKPHEVIARLLEEIALERKLHGRPHALDRQLGRAKGFLANVLAGRTSLHVDTFFELAEQLGLDPVELIARAHGESVCCRPERLLRRYEEPGEGPAVLERLEAWLADPAELETVGRSRGDGDEPREETLRARLGEVDELRFSSARAAPPRAQEVLADTVTALEDRPCRESLAVLCRALGVWASCERALGRYPAAARCLRLALEVTGRLELPGERAGLLERTCYLLSDQGDYPGALGVIRQAYEIYELLHDLPGLGRALVDEARMLVYLGDTAAAITRFSAGLKYLPEKAWHNRFAALHGLAWAYLSLGKAGEAAEVALQATEVHPSRAGQSWCRLDWLLGEIELARGDWAQARAHLEHARQALADHGSPYDLALVYLRLAKALLLAGEQRELRRLAAQMMSLLTTLQKNKIVSAAIQEFLTSVLTSSATVELIERCFRRTEEGCPRRGTPSSRLAVRFHVRSNATTTG